MPHAPLTILPLTPERQADFLRYFEGAAFADNPKWKSCYCQFLYVDHAKVNWAARTAEENRASACERIACGRMQGLLAYRGGEVVGWCNAAPRRMMDSYADEPDPDAARLGQITDPRAIAFQRFALMKILEEVDSGHRPSLPFDLNYFCEILELIFADRATLRTLLDGDVSTLDWLPEC